MTADTLKYNNLQTDLRMFVFCADTRRRTGYTFLVQTLIHFFISVRQFYSLNFVQTSTRKFYFKDNWLKKCSDARVFHLFWFYVFKRVDIITFKSRFKTVTSGRHQNKAWQRITAASRQPGKGSSSHANVVHILARFAYRNCCTFASYIVTSRCHGDILATGGFRKYGRRLAAKRYK